MHPGPKATTPKVPRRPHGVEFTQRSLDGLMGQSSPIGRPFGSYYHANKSVPSEMTQEKNCNNQKILVFEDLNFRCPDFIELYGVIFLIMTPRTKFIFKPYLCTISIIIGYNFQIFERDVRIVSILRTLKVYERSKGMDAYNHIIER